MSKSIADAFKSLKVTGDSSPSEFKHIYQVSYEYLSKVKKFNDLQSFKNCLVALINLDLYEQANKIIAKVPEKLVESLVLEITYVYYKIGKSKEILQLYERYQPKLESKQVQTGLKHVLAQTYYKIGDYKKALNLYKELISESADKSDLLANEQAIISQLIFETGEVAVSGSSTELDQSNYDMLFNEAIIEIAKANNHKALQLLQQAHKVCSENNLTDEDVETELLPINLTIAYVHQLQNDVAKSDEILSGINIDSVNDSLLKLILKNNIQSEKPIDNANLIERQLNYYEIIQQVKQKITLLQLESVLKNSLVLRFATGTLTTNLLNSGPILKLGLVSAAYNALSKNDISYRNLTEAKNNKLVGRKLVRYIQQDIRPDLKEAAVLLLVHINSQVGTFEQSLPFLETLAKQSQDQPKFSPGIVGTLIQVYEATHNTNKLKSLLTTLTEKLLYTAEDAFKDENYYNAAKIIAMKNFSFDNDNSRQLLEYLHSWRPDDDLINSLLTNSNDNLMPISELESSESIKDILSINLDELIPTKSKPIQTVAKKSSKVTKKKRAPKFGKDKVVKPEDEFKLDEERWLPLKLRSYYKPTKKDKKKLGGGHQGAVESSSPVPTSHTPLSSSNKKKKKKGKK